MNNVQKIDIISLQNQGISIKKSIAKMFVLFEIFFEFVIMQMSQPQ